MIGLSPLFTRIIKFLQKCFIWSEPKFVKKGTKSYKDFHSNQFWKTFWTNPFNFAVNSASPYSGMGLKGELQRAELEWKRN